MKSDEQITAELTHATEGLWYMSESDYPFEPVRLEGMEEPTSERLREHAGADANADVETRELDEFFHDGAAVRMTKEGAGAANFEDVVRAFRDNLADIIVYRIGETNVQVYVLGKSGSGTWLGLSTRVVET